MTTRTSSIQTLDREDPIGDLMAMIARRGPELMRQGGGALPREQLWSGRHLELKDFQEIRRLADEGKSMKEIVKLTGWSAKTVWKYMKPGSVFKPVPRAYGRTETGSGKEGRRFAAA